jgi:hypothetical protein
MKDERDKEIENERKDGEAKRTGREGADPESQPGEFADDMRFNRFTPPPPPKREHDH